MAKVFTVLDGNEAAALAAFQTNEVIAIYPITPASPMGEFADAWAGAGRTNMYGAVPRVIEMQSEGGAAGTVHGSLQAGALTTTFTASQGLLLMIPNMFKIAGELLPAVIHVAARTIATHALSIFGDHSDVMAARGTGFAMLCSASVQEAHDFALIAQAVTLESRVPFLHFFDGFRTSHEVNKIQLLPPTAYAGMIQAEWVRAHRERGLNPDRPVLRGSAQNPDVFFQAREAVNSFYTAVPGVVEGAMAKFAQLTGREYKLYEYVGDPEAERVVVLMGSGAGAVEEAVAALNAKGEKVGVLKVRLYRPFAAGAFLAGLPASVKQIAVLDRTKEPGAPGEPLYQDVVAAVFTHWGTRPAAAGGLPTVIGGRYGLSSKEFTPAMVQAVFAEMSAPAPRSPFTVGIHDDVTHLSLAWDDATFREPAEVSRAVFYGLGSDGTVGATKNSTKIIGETTDLHAQGYFVYDSKKAGSVTVSHLRFSARPIHSSYLIQQANFVACHQFNFLERMDILSIAAPEATFLLNSPYAAEEVWDRLPSEVQREIIGKKLKFYVVNGDRVALEAGMPGRINTVLQTCFFALIGVLPREAAIQKIKEAIKKTYGKRGESVLQKNYQAVDSALEALHEVYVPQQATATRTRKPLLPASAPDFVQRVTGLMLAGQGDRLPVSALPVDGTFPTGTSRFEKRCIADNIPIWDPAICIECGLCALVCPHAAIRMKAFPAAAAEAAAGAPGTFQTRRWTGRDLALPAGVDELRMAIQVAPEDCTGCGVCVDVCPARSKEVAKHKAINMQPLLNHLEVEKKNFEYFLSIPEADRTAVNRTTVKGAQLLQPLFEFSGACAGCGETPYLKLLTQLYGDRLMVANATGCSSIYGGNLPTTPWTKNAAGCGAAWANSLFEDNAEFGVGMRLAVDRQEALAKQWLRDLSASLPGGLVDGLLHATALTESEVLAQRSRVAELKKLLHAIEQSQSTAAVQARALLAVADNLVRRSVWIVGGDGWAYDIGFGGLDHALSTGLDINVLVLDTEVYSNTGGQASKATPRGATAKFAITGKQSCKKDLGMITMAYGNVYVARIAMGANPLQTVKVLQEAESYQGPSLIIAYSHCIAHGIDMSTAMTHQKDAVKSGYWPLYRFDPRTAHDGGHPFHLDSAKPSTPFQSFALQEGRFALLARANSEQSMRLLALNQREIDAQWKYYEQLAGVERSVTQAGQADEAPAAGGAAAQENAET
ncbi:MAG: pyruvate:ferredoxin (flavodoxin) oxidoreductase [Planctomycetota bacterium]